MDSGIITVLCLFGVFVVSTLAWILWPRDFPAPSTSVFGDTIVEILAKSENGQRIIFYRDRYAGPMAAAIGLGFWQERAYKHVTKKYRQGYNIGSYVIAGSEYFLCRNIRPAENLKDFVPINIL